MIKDTDNAQRFDDFNQALIGFNLPTIPIGYSYDSSILPAKQVSQPNFIMPEGSSEPMNFAVDTKNIEARELDQAREYLQIGTDEQVIYHFHKSLEPKTLQEIEVLREVARTWDGKIIDSMKRDGLDKDVLHKLVRNRLQLSLLEQENIMRSLRVNMAFDSYASGDLLTSLTCERSESFSLSRALFDFSEESNGRYEYTKQYLSELVGLYDSGSKIFASNMDNDETEVAGVVENLNSDADFYSALFSFVQNLG